MGKKAWSLGIAAAVSAMTLGVAAPASAACPSGVPPLPPTSTVSIADGQIRINPNGPGQDAAGLGGYANDRANEAVSCALGSVPPQVWCSYGLILNVAWYMEYTYEDPYTGEIVIDYGEFLDDTNVCL